MERCLRSHSLRSAAHAVQRLEAHASPWRLCDLFEQISSGGGLRLLGHRRLRRHCRLHSLGHVTRCGPHRCRRRRRQRGCAGYAHNAHRRERVQRKVSRGGGCGRGLHATPGYGASQGEQHLLALVGELTCQGSAAELEPGESEEGLRVG